MISLSSKQYGFTLVEVLISGVLFFVVIVGAMTVLNKIVFFTSTKTSYLQSAELSQQGLEIISAMKTGTGFVNFTSSYPVGTYKLSSLSETPWYELLAVPLNDPVEGPINIQGGSTGAKFYRSIILSEKIAGREWEVTSRVEYDYGQEKIERKMTITKP